MNTTETPEGAPKFGKKHKFKRFLIIFCSTVIVALFAFLCIWFYFPYGKGVKTGQLNYVVYKGIVFKTYEGKLIQSGFWSKGKNGLQSNEFEFSVADDSIANCLMRAGGREVELQYTEYFGRLPWRGHSRYVVTGIIGIKEPYTETNAELPPVAEGE